jgi:hypothetical protein
VRSSGASEAPPEQTASFLSGRAWPERISSRKSALMGASRRGLEIFARKRDRSRLSGQTDGRNGLTVEIEKERA